MTIGPLSRTLTEFPVFPIPPGPPPDPDFAVSYADGAIVASSTLPAADADYVRAAVDDIDLGGTNGSTATWTLTCSASGNPPDHSCDDCLAPNCGHGPPPVGKKQARYVQLHTSLTIGVQEIHSPSPGVGPMLVVTVPPGTADPIAYVRGKIEVWLFGQPGDAIVHVYRVAALTDPSNLPLAGYVVIPVVP